MSLDSELHDSLPPPMAMPAGEIQLQLAAMSLRISRLYAWATSASFVLAGAAVAWQPSSRPGTDSSLVALAFGVVALLAALLGGRMRQPVRLRVAGVGLLGSAGVCVAAVGLGWGVAAPSIGFMALHAGLAMALAGPRLGLLVTVASLLSVWSLAIAQHLMLFSSTGGATPLHLVVLVQTLLIVLVAGGGWVLSGAVARLMQAGEDRERRFRGLLRLSADAYWELDAGLRLVAASQERSGGQPLASGAAMGAIPWELPQFICEPDTLDSLQADLGARQAVRDVPVAWRGREGVRHFLLSGEPRFSSTGVFRGYWGVARDITDDLRARQALARTESRYQDLFASLPSAIVLHRDGRVIDANPAAVTLMGYPDLASMRGAQLLDRYIEGPSRVLARQRIAHLQSLTPGEALPVAEFHIVSRQGREAFVRATGVAVEADGGPAVLSIYVDDTERQAAEEAVRRSEALLSHLVASSPDVITLTDFETGRFAMVNRTFERITGWTAAEVIGRTSLEVTTWDRPEDRDRFVRLVRQLGRVQDIPLQFRTRDGRAVPMLVSGARFVMDRRDYLVINSRDMTEVERSRLEMEAVLENASLGIALTRDQQFQMVNPAFEAMVGWPDGSLIGQSGACVWPSEQAYREIGQRIGPQLSRGEQVEEEVHARRRDGSTFVCRLLARAVDPSHPSRGGTIWVIEDITERKRLDEALARARDAAEAASRAKSAFLANTSHELRTPLNGLLGLAQLARVPGLEEARRTQYLEQIVESAQSLAMIVSDILDLSKIEAGRLSIATSDFDLAEMARSLRRSYAALIVDRPLALTLELDPAVGAVRGDALRVRQILTNYLGNALKFTESGSVRMVVRRSDGDLVRLEVHDTGPGIDAATLSRLFQPFTQADESTTRRYGGTGLGLSICQELATLMDGQVGVQSAPGQGSCFWVELSLPAVTLPDAPASDAAEPPVDTAATQGAHVLMVDDNEINMMVAVAQLEQFGVRVGQAVDGRQALDAVAAAAAAGDPYQLVIMDLQMPVLSGYEVTAALRQRYTPEQLPIVAHTAAALVTEREAALAAGMNDFLPKPTDTELLRRTVARWVRAVGDGSEAL